MAYKFMGALAQGFYRIINRHSMANGIKEVHVVVPISYAYGLFCGYSKVLLKDLYCVVFSGEGGEYVYLVVVLP
jgi:hypothetical protein